MDIEALKFPIGKFSRPELITESILDQWITEISAFPEQLKLQVLYLSDEQLDTQYRPEGWTIRQVIHHCADSHINSLIRLKLALTEEQPTIKPYWEALWAELPDTKNMPIAPSIKIIEGIHERWTILLRSLTKQDLNRTFIHPEYGKIYRIDEYIGVYAWHCNHHLAHIIQAKNRNNLE